MIMISHAQTGLRRLHPRQPQPSGRERRDRRPPYEPDLLPEGGSHGLFQLLVAAADQSIQRERGDARRGGESVRAGDGAAGRFLRQLTDYVHAQ